MIRLMRVAATQSCLHGLLLKGEKRRGNERRREEWKWKERKNKNMGRRIERQKNEERK